MLYNFDAGQPLPFMTQQPKPKYITLKYSQGYIESSSFQPTDCVMLDEQGGFVASGWFVDPKHYKWGRPLISYQEFKAQAKLEKGCYVLTVQIPLSLVEQ